MLKLPLIHGYIDRRILVNFTADPTVVSRILPAGFRPKIYKDKSIVGICLIRLKKIKPKGFPDFIGISSENGAHRVAVEWEENQQTRSGVYIPRRDTSLRLNAMVGGRIFPGRHYHTKFNVKELNGNYHIDFRSSDDTEILIDAKETKSLNSDSIFETLDNASAFFEKGDLGYSPNGERFEGLRLKAYKWEVRPLEVENAKSSFFENQQIFPQGSVKFDHALVMTNIEHEWKKEEDFVSAKITF